jgi:uncharacterized protein (TIGR03067 family)
MKSLLGAAVLLLALADDKADDAKKAEAIKEELRRLQGEWKVEAIEASGTRIPAELRKDSYLEIRGNKYISYKGPRDAKETSRLEGTITIDPTKSPRTLDVQPDPVGETPLDPQRCIYELDGDTLVICNGRSGRDRPERFETKGKELTKTTYKRVKRS